MNSLIIKQFLYFAGNFLINLSLLACLTGSSYFICISICFMINGFVGSYFYNLIISPKLTMRKYKLLYVFMLSSVFFYLLMLDGLIVSLAGMVILIFRNIHDFTRKYYFIKQDCNETFPFIIKFAGTLILYFSKYEISIIVYLATYLMVIFYYRRSESISNFQNNEGEFKPSNFFITLRILSRLSYNLLLPYFIIEKNELETYFYIWAFLAFLAPINDIIEKVFSNEENYFKGIKYVMCTNIACTILLFINILFYFYFQESKEYNNVIIFTLFVLCRNFIYLSQNIMYVITVTNGPRENSVWFSVRYTLLLGIYVVILNSTQDLTLALFGLCFFELVLVSQWPLLYRKVV